MAADAPPMPAPEGPKLPRFWRWTVDARGRTYYFHVRGRVPQWEPPTPDEETPEFSSDDDNASGDADDFDEGEAADAGAADAGVAEVAAPPPPSAREVERQRRRALLCKERIISPRSDFERSDDAQKYRELKERVLRLKLARIRERGLCIEEKKPLPPPPGAKSARDKKKLQQQQLSEKEKLRKKAKEKYKQRSLAAAAAKAAGHGAPSRSSSGPSSGRRKAKASEERRNGDSSTVASTATASASAASSTSAAASSAAASAAASADADGEGEAAPDAPAAGAEPSAVDAAPATATAAVTEDGEGGEPPAKAPDLGFNGSLLDDDPLHSDEDDDDKERERNRDVSANTVRKIKDAFRMKISSVIVQILNPYRRPDCKIGRICCTDDFKHLARKVHSLLSLFSILFQCNSFSFALLSIWIIVRFFLYLLHSLPFLFSLGALVFFRAFLFLCSLFSNPRQDSKLLPIKFCSHNLDVPKALA